MFMVFNTETAIKKMAMLPVEARTYIGIYQKSNAKFEWRFSSGQ